jgi:hypothetical protein
MNASTMERHEKKMYFLSPSYFLHGAEVNGQVRRVGHKVAVRAEQRA